MSDTNQPTKPSGHFHSLKGTAVEAVGHATGAQSWVADGKKEHAAGEAEVSAASAKEYGEGTMDRIQGKTDSVVGAVTGDKAQQASGNVQNEKGQTKQEMNKST